MARRSVLVFVSGFICGGFVCGGAVVGGGIYAVFQMFRLDAVEARSEFSEPERAVVAPLRYAANQPQAQDLTYAFDGCCPVTLIEQEKWRLGNAKYRETRGDQVFLFLGPEQQDRFRQDPDLYIPYRDGMDVVLAKERGEMTRGKREHGLVYNGRIFLFASEALLERFSTDPMSYLSIEGDIAANQDADGAQNRWVR